MNLAPMRYKDYVWPHNPETYTISFKRQVAVAKVPFGRYGMQDLGMSYRVMEGEGVFAGKGAYDEFKKLASGTSEDKDRPRISQCERYENRCGAIGFVAFFRHILRRFHRNDNSLCYG